MKKVLAMVICVAMLACFALTASAATDATLTVATVEGKKGNVVAVDIAISEGSNIGALEIALTADETLLKATTTKDKRGNDVYFQAGDAVTSNQAVADGSDGLVEGKILLTTACVNGYWEAGVIWTVYYEVLADLEAPVVVDAECTTVGHYDSEDEVINLTVVDGAVKAPAAVEPQPPVSSEDNKPSEPTKPSTPNKPVDPEKPTTTETDKENPKTGDVSGIAVAAGLCAVMAAAFVISKKVND